MAFLSLVILLFIVSTVCGEKEGKKAFSASSAKGKSNNDQESSQDALHEKIRNLERLNGIQEKRMARLEALLLQSGVSSEAKAELVSALQTRGVEEDVQQNKEDIIDLRINDGRHDMLISQGMLNTNYINNTIIPDVEHRIDIQLDNLREVDAFVDSTRPPIGSIIAWLPMPSKTALPDGWKRCDGTMIKSGPLSGMATPDLNSAGRFLRGGLDERAGTMEEDSVQEHLHTDPGHTHKDNGHSHVDNGHSHYEDSEHFPLFVGSDVDHHEDLVCTRYYSHDLFNGDCGGYYVKFNAWTTEAGKASIASASASIQNSNTGLGGMSTGKAGEETKPKNMNVVYIIRTF